MIRKCSYSGCGDRRIHYERPDEKRPHREIEVPDNYPLDRPVHCSIECMLYHAGELKRKELKLKEIK
jgi:hypothetical protein